MSDHGGSEDSLRIDKLLWYLRLTKSRERAQAKIAEGHVRVDGRRVERASTSVRAGAVVVLPIGGEVTVVRVDRLPERRGPAPEAQAHYTLLSNRGNASDSQLSATIEGIGRDPLDEG